MSDEPDNHPASGARGQPPAAARPGIAPPPKAAAPRLPPPPAFVPPKLAGASKPAAALEPAGAPKNASAPKPVAAPTSASAPRPAGVPSKPASAAKPAGTPKPASASTPVASKPAVADVRGAASKVAEASASARATAPSAGSKPAGASAAGSAMASAPAVAGSGARAEGPSLEALRRGAVASPRPGSAATPGTLGLPPPPEFLPRASSAELPLENWVGDVSEELASVTLPGIPPPRAGEVADDDRDASRKLDLRDLARMLPAVAEPTATADPGESVEDDVDAPIDLEDHDPAAASHQAEADEGEDVDIDVSEDTLPRIAALREPYPVLPHAPSQVPTAPVPVVKPGPLPSAAALVAPALGGRGAPGEPRNRTARLLEARVTQPTRPLGLWIAVGAAVGAVISILVLLWISASGPEKDASPAATSTPAEVKKTSPAPTPTPTAPEAKVEPAPEPTPIAPEAKAEPAPSAPEAKAEPEPAPAPAEAPAEPAPAEAPAEPAPDEPPSEASVITVQRDRSEYQRAAAEYRATGSQASLLAMTTAACELSDGPHARWAFRKLVGKTLRTKAIAACQAAHVDVTSTVEGYTGAELLAQARAALEAGDAKTALDKAHQSNKVERSSEAVLIKALAACKLGDGPQAQRLMPHVSIKSRARLVEGCNEAGIELRD